MKQMIEKRIKRNMEILIIFIDLEKTYDNFPIKNYHILDNSVINGKYILAIIIYIKI